MASDPRADVLLMTVTTVEAAAVLEAFGVPAQRKPRSIDGRVYFDLGTVNGARVRMTRCEMGAGGLGGSLQAVSKGITTGAPVPAVDGVAGTARLFLMNWTQRANECLCVLKEANCSPAAQQNDRADERGGLPAHRRVVRPRPKLTHARSHIDPRCGR